MTDTYNIRENDVTTIIASTGELGIKIGNQCFFFDAKNGFYELSKDKYVTSPYDIHQYCYYEKWDFPEIRPRSLLDVTDIPNYSEAALKWYKKNLACKAWYNLPQDVDEIDEFFAQYFAFVTKKQIEAARVLIMEFGQVDGGKNRMIIKDFDGLMSTVRPKDAKVQYFLRIKARQGSNELFTYVWDEENGLWLDIPKECRGDDHVVGRLHGTTVRAWTLFCREFHAHSTAGYVSTMW